jgi:ABC-type dipeptide/oligopeptide/nickel transport system permease component
MLVFFFTYKLRIFETAVCSPLKTRENLINLILPVIALSIRPSRSMRVSSEPAYWKRSVRTIKDRTGKGLRDEYSRAMLAECPIPAITLFGLSVATLWTGAFITERIFNWPGVGRLATTALLNKDYPVVQAIVFLVTISYVLGNLLVDIGYAFADPRIRYVRRR